MDPRYSAFTSAMEMLGTMHSTRPSSALVGSTLHGDKGQAVVLWGSEG